MHEARAVLALIYGGLIVKKTKAQKICKICFVVIFTITLILWCVLPAISLHYEMNDGVKDFEGLGAFIVSCTLFAMLLHELVFYICLRYFLGERETRRLAKTILFTLLFFVNLLVLFKGVAFYFPLFR
jgi:hypothetical protein